MFRYVKRTQLVDTRDGQCFDLTCTPDVTIVTSITIVANITIVSFDPGGSFERLI